MDLPATPFGHARKRALLGLHTDPEALEQRVVGMEDQGALRLVGPGMRVNAGRARHHLFEPGTRADVGQRRHHGHLGYVQPLIGHRDRHQDRGLRLQSEGGDGLVGARRVRRRQLRHLPGLVAGKPALDRFEIPLRVLLVGRDHQQLAQARGGFARGKAALLSPAGAQVADTDKRFAQQRLGEAGAERREQRRAGGLVRIGGGEPVRPDLDYLLRRAILPRHRARRK